MKTHTFSAPLPRIACALGLSLMSACTTPTATIQDDLHRRLLTLDTHLDIPAQFGRAGWSFGDRHNLTNDVSQVDLPRMEDGNLDGGFFVIFTDPGPLTPAGYADAQSKALRRSAEIDEMLARFPDRIAPARTAADAMRLHASGKLIAYKSIENSYPLGEDVSMLAEFQRQGVRLAGPVHTLANQFADSATDKPRWNGLSPLGRQWVAEMNRLGMVIDASHASDAAFDQMLSLSKAPILLSHSGSRSLYDHPRNIDDDRLRRLAANGGAICFATIYLSPIQVGPERAVLFDRLGDIAKLNIAEQRELIAKWQAMNQTAPMWTANFEIYMTALLHVISVAGVDHVCFGADWDGGGGIAGLNDITALPKVTERLKREGFSDADLAKMWSGNVLRILQAAEHNIGVSSRDR